MNEKKSSPIATIKGIFGSSKILFICIVYTVAVVSNIIQKFEDRIDFKGMSFFGISLSDVIGSDMVEMLQTVSNVLFVISLISLLPKALMAVGYWLIKKGAGEGNGNTRSALIALDFFKYNLLYQACMKVMLAFLIGVIGVFGAYLSFSNGASGVGFVILIAAAVVVGILVFMFKYYTGFMSMLVGVSNTLRTGVNLVMRSRLVFVVNVLSAIWIVLTSFGNGFIAILAGVADALCLIFINRCFVDFENVCGYANKEDNAEVMERIKTDPSLAKTADALGIQQITPEESAQGVKPTLSLKGIAMLLFGLSIAPIDEAGEYDAHTERPTATYTADRTLRSATGASAATVARPQSYAPPKEAEYRLLSLFANDPAVLDRRYTLLGETEFVGSVCPVELRSAAVVKDQVSEKNILRLSFANTSVCSVKKVLFDIVPQSNTEEKLCIYKNVGLPIENVVASGESFGTCFGVILPDAATNGIVKITYVEFDDGLYWDKQSDEKLFLTDEKRAHDKAVLDSYEAKRCAQEERGVAANNDDHSDEDLRNRSDESDAGSTPIKESIAPLVLAILSAVSLVLGIFVPYFIFKNFGSGFISTANLNVVSLISLVMNLLPFALAFSSLLARKRSAKYGKIASGISIAVIVLTSVQRLMGGVENLLITLVVVCIVFGIIALVKKDRPLYVPLLLIAVLSGVLILVPTLGDIGKNNSDKQNDPWGTGGNTTVQGEEATTVAEEIAMSLIYQSNGDSTCKVVGVQEGQITSRLEIPQYSSDGELVTGIGDYAFSFHGAIFELILPECVEYIGLNAFEECYSLQSVSMPGVTYVAHNAFRNCTSLNQVTQTYRLEGIGENAFENCTSLSCFEYAPQLRNIGSSAFFKAGLSEFIMPDSVTNIGQNAFYGCDRLYSLRLSKNLEKIPYGAFADCTSLQSVHIPGSVTNIEGDAFSYCSSLTTVVMYPGVICIEQRAFTDCDALQDIHFPESIGAIENGAFYDSNNILRISYGGTEEMWREFIWEPTGDYSWTGINNQLHYADMSYGVEPVEDAPDVPEHLIQGSGH